MRISGLQKNSMVDYPEKLAAAVFTQGCNMNCGYCHNRLIGYEKTGNIRGGCVCVPGKAAGPLTPWSYRGEPTLQRICRGLSGARKWASLLLDTNGTNPELWNTLSGKAPGLRGHGRRRPSANTARSAVHWSTPRSLKGASNPARGRRGIRVSTTFP